MPNDDRMPHAGVPGVFGRKFTVCRLAFEFTGIPLVGDQKGCQKLTLSQPVKSRSFSRVCADHLRFPI
jgi:hypothetical protein